MNYVESHSSGMSLISTYHLESINAYGKIFKQISDLQESLLPDGPRSILWLIWAHCNLEHFRRILIEKHITIMQTLLQIITICLTSRDVKSPTPLTTLLDFYLVHLFSGREFLFNCKSSKIKTLFLENWNLVSLNLDSGHEVRAEQIEFILLSSLLKYSTPTACLLVPYCFVINHFGKQKSYELIQHNTLQYFSEPPTMPHELFMTQ